MLVEEISDSDLLKYAIENGIIDRSTIQKNIEMSERKKFLEQHEHKIWQGKDGKYYTYIPDQKAKRGKRLIRRNAKEELNSAIVDYYKSVEEEPYVSDVFRMWIENKLRMKEITPQTNDKYHTNFKRFFENKSIPIADKKIKYIGEDTLEEFIKVTIADLELTSKAYGDMRILINGIWKYAKKHGYTDLSITNFMGDLDISNRSFKRVIVNPHQKVFFSNEEKMVEDFIMENPTIIGLGIALAFQTGLRAGEISALRWQDVYPKYISVSGTEVRYRGEDGKYIFERQEFPKTDAGYREVVLTDEAIRIIKKIRSMNPFGEWVFCKNGKRVKAQAFSRRLYVICDNVGIEYRSMHKARTTYGTKLIDAKVPDSVIIDQMGHSDIETTRRYYYKLNKSGKEIAKAINEALME